MSKKGESVGVLPVRFSVLRLLCLPNMNNNVPSRSGAICTAGVCTLCLYCSDLTEYIPTLHVRVPAVQTGPDHVSMLL
jgi:hypothetical protein